VNGDALDQRRQYLIRQRERHIRRCQPGEAMVCTARLDELDELERLLRVAVDDRTAPGPTTA
jgi:hypothetical protein